MHATIEGLYLISVSRRGIIKESQLSVGSLSELGKEG
jgi:hypothetical protein